MPRKELDPNRDGWAICLSKLREAKEPIQKRFAKSIGVEPATYQRYEGATAQPSVQTWLKISTALGVTVDFIMNAGRVRFNLTIPDVDPALIAKTLDAAASMAVEAAMIRLQSEHRHGRQGSVLPGEPSTDPKE